MAEIQRIEVGARLSECTVHAGTVYLAGQVAVNGGSIREQTTEVLNSIDRLLAQAGSNRDRILMAQIFLADMSDYAALNEVWEKWVVPGNTPCRVTIQAPGTEMQNVAISLSRKQAVQVTSLAK